MKSTYPINLNKKFWESLTYEERDDFALDIFTHYRNTGFPYFPTDTQWRQNEFRKLKNYDNSNLIEDDIVKQTMHGLSLAWSYMSHSWGVVCNDMKTPLEVFHDDDLFRKVIDKRLRFGDNISDNGIRKMLKIFTGTQSVSNFRPTAASAIYNRYCQGGVTWDMSSGFGGRLLGSAISDVHYIGTDPSTETFKGLTEINQDFNIGAELYNCGSEDYLPESKSIDLCFTSPPYFDTEKYSDEDTQSYIRYPSKEQWLTGYLKRTLLSCHYGLKDDGYLAINIANVKSYPNLENDCISVADASGFKLDHILKLALSNINNSGFKYEPIFFFKIR